MQKFKFAAVQSLQATFTNQRNQKLILTSIPTNAHFQRTPVSGGIVFIHDTVKKSKKKLNAFFREVKKRTAETLWVICTTQEPDEKGGEEDTHCIAFVYRPADKCLIIFDPGSLCYGTSEDTKDAIKLFLSVAPKTTKQKSLMTKMQCNQTDTYCQSWSLMFLAKYKETHSIDFVPVWEKLTKAQKKKMISGFMLEHATSDDSFSTYKYKIMYDWWMELRNEHQVDVYWDNQNVQSLVDLAKLGFGGYGGKGKIIKIPSKNIVNLNLNNANVGKWPRPSPKKRKQILKKRKQIKKPKKK